MGCLQAIGCLLCLAVLAVAGVLAWRYGPWYEDGATTEAAPPDTLAALGACEGCCNLLASNCDRPVNEVLFPAVHNAMSSYDDLFAGANNNRPLEEALVAGYRGLMLDSCICDGSIGETLQNLIKGEDDKGENYLGFCHGSCDAGVRDPAQVLRNVKTFLDVNPNEVLILEFEVTDNSLEQLFNAIDDSGLDEYIYRPSATDAEWPTMQSLIDTGARALVFAHGDGMDQSCTATNCPEGIMYTFDHFEQTEWNGEAAPTGCDVIGTEREAQSFFLMNHWKNSEDTGLPSEDNAEVYNTYEKLMERFTSCTERIPTVLAVDFWSIGDVLSFTEEVNQRNAGVVAGEKI